MLFSVVSTTLFNIDEAKTIRFMFVGRGSSNKHAQSFSLFQRARNNALIEQTCSLSHLVKYKLLQHAVTTKQYCITKWL